MRVSCPIPIETLHSLSNPRQVSLLLMVLISEAVVHLEVDARVIVAEVDLARSLVEVVPPPLLLRLHAQPARFTIKIGHVALQCYHRFDHAFQLDAPPLFSANHTTPSSFSDST